MYEQFARAITKNVEHGFAIAVDVQSFHALHKSIKSALGDDPHFLAVDTVLQQIVDYAAVFPNPSAAIICDDDAEKACETYRRYKRAQQRNARFRSVLKSIAFGDDSYYPQLQAADLFSWVTRAEAFYRFFGENYSLRTIFTEFNMSYAEKKIRYDSGFWGDEHLKELGDQVLAQLNKLKKRVR
jgi:hypothetical protein